MKVRIAGLFILISVFALAANTIRSQTSKSQAPKNTSGNMSEAERALLNEINQARANPQLYASYLEKMKPLFKGKQYTVPGRPALITEEGWNAVDEAIKFMRSSKPTGALNPSRGLSLAAMSHVKDQSGSGNTGHQSGNRMMIEDRVKPFGNWQGNIGENITYGDDSARERLLTWLIDDGFPSRGHRKRVMSSDYKVVGISCGSHPQFNAMCVLTLAGGFVDVPSSVTSGTGNGGGNGVGNGPVNGTGNGTGNGAGSGTPNGTGNGSGGNGAKPSQRSTLNLARDRRSQA